MTLFKFQHTDTKEIFIGLSCDLVKKINNKNWHDAGWRLVLNFS